MTRPLNKTLLFLIPVAVIWLTGIPGATAQHAYTASNAHAHNDYNHALPFWNAYRAGFGSIEADVFLIDTTLYVAHNLTDTARGRTLQSLYLEPLQHVVQRNDGYAYGDRSKTLLLLVDIKTAAVPTLARIVAVLNQYKNLTETRNLKVVITGNQPEIATFTGYPPFIWFDGNPNKEYTSGSLSRIALFSDNFRRYSKWDGEGSPDPEENTIIHTLVRKAHSLNKPIRFWNAPDKAAAWKQFVEYKADYINTDKIPEISAFFLNLAGRK